MKLAKDDPTLETLTFDLEKTLPRFTKDNYGNTIGIHIGSKDEANCNVWL